MKKFIRFDSIGGASGDMILAALTSVGADLDKIETQLNSFFPEHLHIKSAAAADSGLNGLSVSVQSHHHHNHDDHHQHDDSHWPDADEGHEHHHEDSQSSDAGQKHAHHHHDHSNGHTHRGLKEISELINGSDLSAKTKSLSIAVFTRLARAEAKIHGKTADTVHFHEVGAWDSVADIVGSCIALEQLGIAGISCSELPCGTGTITCAHGIMPNPAPATQELLIGIPVVQTEEPFEMVTPTGAAILATWMCELEQPPATCIPIKNGFGFGSRKLNTRPNVLRATIQKASETQQKAGYNNLTVLESNLDDCNPEWLGELVDDLLKKGALDAWHTPIIMKKGRPAVMLSVLTTPENSGICTELIFRSTTTFGIRSHSVERNELERDFVEATTPWGAVPVKRGKLRGKTITLAPEHEACLNLARANEVTVKEVSNAAFTALKCGEG